MTHCKIMDAIILMVLLFIRLLDFIIVQGLAQIQSHSRHVVKFGVILSHSADRVMIILVRTKNYSYMFVIRL